MRVMIIGASSDRRKFGNKAVRAYRRAGHEILPVNPNEQSVEGITTYADVRIVPPPVDRVTFYVPPEVGITLLAGLKERGDITEIWLNPGAESPELVAEARRLGLTPILACSIVDIGETP